MTRENHFSLSVIFGRKRLFPKKVNVWFFLFICTYGHTHTNINLWIFYYLFASEVVLGLESMRVQEHSDSASHSSGRKVFLESGNYDTIGTMSSGDISEDALKKLLVLLISLKKGYSVFGVALQGVSLVNVGNSLSEIERSLEGVINTLDLKESLVFVLSDLGSIQ